jgi:hypothetical protein
MGWPGARFSRRPRPAAEMIIPTGRRRAGESGGGRGALQDETPGHQTIRPARSHDPLSLISRGDRGRLRLSRVRSAPAKLDPLADRVAIVALSHAALHLDRAAHRREIHRAGSFGRGHPRNLAAGKQGDRRGRGAAASDRSGRSRPIQRHRHRAQLQLRLLIPANRRSHRGDTAMRGVPCTHGIRYPPIRETVGRMSWTLSKADWRDCCRVRSGRAARVCHDIARHRLCVFGSAGLGRGHSYRCDRFGGR